MRSCCGETTTCCSERRFRMDEGRAGAPGHAMPAPAAGSLAPRLEFWTAKGSTIVVELAAFLRARTKAWLRPAQDDDSPPPGAAGYMGAWRTAASRNIAIVAVFSVAVNLLMLTLPIYLFQISDRVLTSRSADTLLMLSMLALCFVAVLSLPFLLRRP